MRENGGLNFYRNLMKHEVTVDRNKTAPRCRKLDTPELKPHKKVKEEAL